MSDPGHPLTPSLVAVKRSGGGITDSEEREVSEFLANVRRHEQSYLVLPSGWEPLTVDVPAKMAHPGIFHGNTYTCSFCGREVVDHWELDPCENCGGRTGITEASGDTE